MCACVCVCVCASGRRRAGCDTTGLPLTIESASEKLLLHMWINLGRGLACLLLAPYMVGLLLGQDVIFSGLSLHVQLNVAVYKDLNLEFATKNSFCHEFVARKCN